LVQPNCASLVPPEFDATTPVVVATLAGGKGADVFGSTKITSGSMYQKFTMADCQIIFYPAREVADIWWTMSTTW
ncbi:MAG: hypothetical protein Q7V53_06600, partial [Caldisericota bacterium]|nr:hypothetical protein [Caldisericota bacterium]